MDESHTRFIKIKSIEIVKTIKQLNIGNTVQTSSDHKIADVKQTDTGNIGRNNTIRIKSEIEATCNSPISCLKRKFLAIPLMIYLLFIH